DDEAVFHRRRARIIARQPLKDLHDLILSGGPRLPSTSIRKQGADLQQVPRHVRRLHTERDRNVPRSEITKARSLLISWCGRQERLSSMTRQTAPRRARFAISAAVTSTLLSIVGCGTPPGQFLIIQNQVPEKGCLVPVTLGSVYRGTGDLD